MTSRRSKWVLQIVVWLHQGRPSRRVAHHVTDLKLRIWDSEADYSELALRLTSLTCSVEQVNNSDAI